MLNRQNTQLPPSLAFDTIDMKLLAHYKKSTTPSDNDQITFFAWRNWEDIWRENPIHLQALRVYGAA